ncbi:LCP family protein [Streptomyces poonensis]|uniref:Transcriptional regulator n=1 Tax=Streptomyces poonensis TaxID=68255 RepID=A0A918UJZ8_9ACTN|nr:LCP family protein [Streptomyces poonensis]GGZ17085.1 transcriptional regulator [Streptomyces poonensis]GLJ92461.1 transcriptional regulator [Streptomyces poonensis]
MARSGVRGDRRQSEAPEAGEAWNGSPSGGHGPYEGNGPYGQRNDGHGPYGQRSPEADAGGSAPPPAPQGRGRRRRAPEDASGRPRRRRRVLRWSASVLAVLILGTAGAGYLYYQHLNGNIKKDDLNLGDTEVAKPTPNAAGQTPLNILLIGSDARDSKENQKLGGAKETFGGTPLADVQMLLHLSADRTNMSVISMPRDTLVQIPKCTDPDDGEVYPASDVPLMTNRSLGRGGPGCTVATWQELTGIHIDHFMMVDFAGVVSMADAIGGVPVCVDANIYSKDSQGHGSGLKLEKGTTYVQGEQALQWLRTRYGFEDGSDIARAKAQHQYMNAMVRELRENATITNPNKLRKLAEEATKALTVDQSLGSVKALYDLSTELRKVEPERITMTTMPYTYVGARVVPKEGDAEQLFRLVREDIALDGKDAKKKETEDKVSDDPAAPDDEIGVLVQNGTSTSTQAAVQGRAGTLSGLLVEKGFTKATADRSTVSAEEKTVVRYPSAELEGDAQAVAEALGIPLSSVKRSTDVSGVTLVVGADWREGTAYEVKKEDDTTPKSADALNGANKTACMKVDPDFTW